MAAPCFAGMFDDFTFAVFDKAGFCTCANEQKIEGALSQNFSNSAGVSLFVDEGYDEDDFSFRGGGLFALSCFYDYAKIGGKSHHNIRYGLDSSFCFINLGIFQNYDFSENKIDWIGLCGLKFGKWLCEYAALELNAGIEHGFLSSDNIVRINAGVLFVPFQKSKKKIPASQIDEIDSEEKIFEEIATQKIGTKIENVNFVKDADEIENPYRVKNGEIYFIESFAAEAYTEDGAVFFIKSSNAYFFVYDSPETKSAKPPSRAFLRSRGTKKIFLRGTERIVPAFEFAYILKRFKSKRKKND